MTLAISASLEPNYYEGIHKVTDLNDITQTYSSVEMLNVCKRASSGTDRGRYRERAFLSCSATPAS